MLNTGLKKECSIVSWQWEMGGGSVHRCSKCDNVCSQHENTVVMIHSKLCLHVRSRLLDKWLWWVHIDKRGTTRIWEFISLDTVFCVFRSWRFTHAHLKDQQRLSSQPHKTSLPRRREGCWQTHTLFVRLLKTSKACYFKKICTTLPGCRMKPGHLKAKIIREYGWMKEQWTERGMANILVVRSASVGGPKGRKAWPFLFHYGNFVSAHPKERYKR